jgi:hypothetical protein
VAVLSVTFGCLHPVTPEHAKTAPSAEKHHTTPRLRNSKYTPKEKKTGVRRNTTRNSHQTNTHEDRDLSISQPASLMEVIHQSTNIAHNSNHIN